MGGSGTVIGEHRYELKFLVGADSKNALLKLCEEGLDPDPYGDQGVYRVSSLYFDSPSYDAYWEKLDGVRNRAKYRLRYYGEEPLESKSYFEIKHRWDQTVFKERVPLKAGSLETLFSDRSAIYSLHEFTEELSKADQLTLERILTAAARGMLQPVNIISYSRQAWVGRHDNRLRVTFDHLCTTHEPDHPCRPIEAPGTPFLPQGQMVLEVKFNSRLPVWLRDAVSKVSLSPIRFSKYVEGLMAMEDLPVRRRLARREVALHSPLDGKAHGQPQDDKRQ